MLKKPTQGDSKGLRMNKFTVRRLDNSDLDDFRRVRLEALGLHPEAFGASFEDERQQPAAFFAARLRSDTVLGGFDCRAALQGIVGLRFHHAPKMRHVATLWGMYVRADMRGTGLSRALLDAAIQAAGAVRTIKLSVVTTNQPAQALYHSAGFRAWATDAEALCVEGRFYDDLLMRRDSQST
jgi:ribosomal protein S18 acetylase RimI-like enzyme